MNIQQLFRHPKTRLSAGFALHILNAVALAGMMTISLGLDITGITLSFLLLYTAFDRWRVISARNREEAKIKRHATYFTTGNGVPFKAFIAKLCLKVGIPTPSIEHDPTEFALAQSWPYTEKILINDGIEKDQQEIQQAVLAHELAHIYNQDQIKLELSAFLQIFHIYAFVASTVLLIGMTAFQLYQSTFADPILFSFITTGTPLTMGILLCTIVTKLAAGIIIRATESQADLTGCVMLEDPSIPYQAFTLQGNDEKPLYHTYKSYLNSWFTQHPSDWQRKEDIAIQYPTEISKFRIV